KKSCAPVDTSTRAGEGESIAPQPSGFLPTLLHRPLPHASSQYSRAQQLAPPRPPPLLPALPSKLRATCWPLRSRFSPVVWPPHFSSWAFLAPPSPSQASRVPPVPSRVSHWPVRPFSPTHAPLQPGGSWVWSEVLACGKS